MKTTVLKEIAAFLFGRKYYANIIVTKGTTNVEICSYIFASRWDADWHKTEIENTMSYVHLETVHFRSRRVLPERVKSYARIGK